MSEVVNAPGLSNNELVNREVLTRNFPRRRWSLDEIEYPIGSYYRLTFRKPAIPGTAVLFEVPRERGGRFLIKSDAADLTLKDVEFIEFHDDGQRRRKMTVE